MHALHRLHCLHLSFYYNIISYIFMWITMNAIGKSIITGRYTYSFTRQAGLRRVGASKCSPLGGLSVEYTSLTWADVIFCAAFVSCRSYLILDFWHFNVSSNCFSCAPWWTRQSSPNSPSCWRKGSWRRLQREPLWRPQRWPTMEMFTYCTLTPNIIKAVRETMAGAMNATVEMTGGHLDLSDISDKTILYVAVGAGEKFCN